MVEEKIFDKTQISHIENGLKTVANMNYDLCLHQCNMDRSNSEAGCKQACYNDILVPFNMLKHEARSPEETLYKQCLAKKYPNLTQQDFISCSNNVYADRVEMMMNAFTTHAKDTIVRMRN